MRTPRLAAIAILAIACGGSAKDTLDSAPVGTGETDTQPVEETDTEDTVDGGDWTILSEARPGALLALWGATADDLWVVGADGGAGPELLHLDGGAWTAIDAGSPGDLWWVWGDGQGSVYAVGTGGRLLEIDASTHAVTETILDPALTLFGVWGSSPTDIWVVGGNPFLGDGAELWHQDGSGWAQVTDVPATFEGQSYGFKVWGSGPDDIWVVGAGLMTMHWDGATWTDHAAPAPDATQSLFTVSGDGDGAVYAVGGVGLTKATLLAWDGADWADETPADAGQLNGVSAVAGADPVACGKDGRVYARTGGSWAEHPAGRPTGQDLHACWVDPDGGVWTVGGHMASYPLTDGVLAYTGPGAPPAP